MTTGLEKGLHFWSIVSDCNRASGSTRSNHIHADVHSNCYTVSLGRASTVSPLPLVLCYCWRHVALNSTGLQHSLPFVFFVKKTSFRGWNRPSELKKVVFCHHGPSLLDRTQFPAVSRELKRDLCSPKAGSLLTADLSVYLMCAFRELVDSRDIWTSIPGELIAFFHPHVMARQHPTATSLTSIDNCAPALKCFFISVISLRLQQNPAPLL